jgi:carbon storage regulator
MLVLSRKPGEKILVGDITITVVRIGPNTVRIGIEAPHDMKIVRQELLIEAQGIGDAEQLEFEELDLMELVRGHSVDAEQLGSQPIGPAAYGTIDMDRVHHHSDTAVAYQGIVVESEVS